MSIWHCLKRTNSNVALIRGRPAGLFRLNDCCFPLLLVPPPRSSFVWFEAIFAVECDMQPANVAVASGLQWQRQGRATAPTVSPDLYPPIQQVSPRSLHFLLLATTNITILPPFSYCFHVHQSRKIARCKPCTPYCILYTQKIFGLCSGMRWCCSSSSEAMHKCMLYILHCM